MKYIKTTVTAVLEKINAIVWIQAIRQYIETRKIIQKILCLIIAAVLWYYNDTRRIAESHYRIPVQVDMSREYAIADMEKRQVTVLVRGSAEDIRNVGQNNISAYLRIQNPTPGDAVRYPVKVLGNDIPESVKLETEDQTLFVMVEKRMTKRVVLEPAIEGSVDSGYFVGNCRISPPEIDISGAESILKKIRFLRIEPVSVTGYTSTFRAPVKLNQDSIKYLDLYQKGFEIEVPVFDMKNTVRLSRTIVIKNIPETVPYSAGIKNVSVYVRSEKPDSLEADDFEVYADGSESPVIMQGAFPDGESQISLQVHVKSKSAAAVVTVVPDSIQLKVRK